MVQDLLTNTWLVLVSFWQHIPWGYLAASGVISPALVAVKNWLSIESKKKYRFIGIRFTGEQVMFLLLAGVSSTVMALQYIVQQPDTDPSVIALHAAVLGFTTQPVYFLIVKPLIQMFRDQVAQAAAFNKELAEQTEQPV